MVVFQKCLELKKTLDRVIGAFAATTLASRSGLPQTERLVHFQTFFVVRQLFPCQLAPPRSAKLPMDIGSPALRSPIVTAIPSL